MPAGVDSGSRFGLRAKILIMFLVIVVVALGNVVVISLLSQSLLSPSGGQAAKAAEQMQKEYERLLRTEEKTISSEFHDEIVAANLGKIRSLSLRLMETELVSEVHVAAGDGKTIYAISSDLYAKRDKADFDDQVAAFKQTSSIPAKEQAEVDQLAKNSAENALLVMPSEKKNALAFLRRLGQASTADGYVVTVFDLSSLANIQENLKKQREEELSSFRVSSTVFTLVGGIILLSVAGLGFLFIGKALKPIFEVQEAAERMALGDNSLEVAVTTNDEIGAMARSFGRMRVAQVEKSRFALRFADGDLREYPEPASDKDELGVALKKMCVNLSSVLGEFQTMAEQVARDAAEIEGFNKNLSNGASTQAAAIEESSSSMTEVDKQARQNSKRAQEVSNLVGTAEKAAIKGDSSMKELLDAMNAISEANRQIATIIKLTDDIAFQTNLLALNAAVEAARAGKHGKGFAVVAEEVRNLSARSAKAAQETANLIANAGARVAFGAKVAEETAKVLSEIRTNIFRAGELSVEIAKQSEHQAIGIGELTTGLSQVSSVTQQTVSFAGHTSEKAKTLRNNADHVHSLLAQFRLR